MLNTDHTVFCGGGNSCREGYYCAKSNENPSNGATNFDNVMFALLQVFQIVSMEGWTAIMVALMQSVGTWIVIYFYPIIFIGAFFLLNLTLAVIKAKFTEEMSTQQENGGPVKKKKKLDDAPLSAVKTRTILPSRSKKSLMISDTLTICLHAQKKTR